MDNKRKAMKRSVDCLDCEYYVTSPWSLSSSFTDSDHEIARTENFDEGNGVLASPKATGISGELEDCNNEIPFYHPAAPICSSSTSSSSKTNRPCTGLGLPSVSRMGDPIIEIDLTSDSEDEDKEILEMSLRQMPSLLPLSTLPRAISKSKQPKTDANIHPAITVATASKPQPSAVSARNSFAPEVETAKSATATMNKNNRKASSSAAPSVNAHNSTGYPYHSSSESCHFHSHSSTNTGSDSSQYQNPNRNYFCQSPWGENMEYNSRSDLIPPPPDFSLPSFDFSYFPRSRYSAPGEPRTLITINTNADATNTAQTRAPLASFDSASVSVRVPVPAPNPQSVSASVDIEKEIQEKEGRENGTMLAGVEVKDQPDQNQNQPGSPACTVPVARTASSSSSGYSIDVTGPAETLVNTSSSNLVPSSITSTKKPCTNSKKEPVRLERVSRPLIKGSRYVKHGFSRLYDISTDATGTSEEYSCIVGGCKFESKIYKEIENHLTEKHLKSSELTEKLALFTSFTFTPRSTNGREKTGFLCNFVGCEKEVMSSTCKSHHVTNKHLDKRNYCPVQNCHEKFLYEKQLAPHFAAFHRVRDNNGGKQPKPGNASQPST